MGSSSSTLSTLQRELLGAFFDRTQSFFLTGGAALAEFYLHHRETKDLDLFATPEAQIEDGVRALIAASQAITAIASIMQADGDFRRFAVARDGELTLVDLVIDRAPQAIPEKTLFGRVRVDPPREIAANKLCALLDRSEPRDLVDLKLLLASGLRLEDACNDALVKHASADPATLAWAIAQLHLEPASVIPAGVDLAGLEKFRTDLVDQLACLALPHEP
jgi:hypothetical protein